MLTHMVSPRFDHRKLQPPFYRDVVDVFEDRMRGWLLRPALKLLDGDDFSVAAVALATNYFEGIEIYHAGEDSVRKSKQFFRRGFFRVFRLRGQPERIQTAVTDSLYESLRCGFAHDGMARSGINFSNVRKEPLLVSMKRKEGAFDPTAPLGAVVINPRLFVEGIEQHFTSYVQELRRAKDVKLKENFEKAVALKWGLGQPGKVMGLTEEQFLRGEVPDAP